MATTEFDTLATADELRAAGIQARHAKAIVTAIGQSRGGLLTASRFEAALGEIRGDMKADRAEYAAALGELRSDMKADRAEYAAALGELRSDMKADRAEYAAALSELRSDMKADRAEYAAALGQLRNEMQAGFAGFSAALAELKSEIYRYMWLQGGAIIVILTSLYALVESWARGLL